MTPIQLWVRNRVGQVWGPLTALQIATLRARGSIVDAVECSRDGQDFIPLAQEPALVVAPTPARSASAPPSQDSSQDSSPGAKAGDAAAVEAPVATTAASVRVGSSPSGSEAFPRAGWLEELSGLRIYYLVAVAEASGRLDLGEGPTAITITFKHGTPQSASSEAMGLGPFLVAQGIVSAPVLAAAQQRIAAAGGGDLASGLFAAGLLNPSTAFPLIQQHAHQVLQRALLLVEGPFVFDPTAPLPASGFPLGSRWQLLSAAARKIDLPSLQKRLASHRDESPQLAGSVAELQLTAQETRLLSQLDGQRSLGELIEADGALGDSLQRLVLLLQEIDRLTWGPPRNSVFSAPPIASEQAVSNELPEFAVLGDEPAALEILDSSGALDAIARLVVAPLDGQREHSAPGIQAAPKPPAPSAAKPAAPSTPKPAAPKAVAAASPAAKPAGGPLAPAPASAPAQAALKKSAPAAPAPKVAPAKPAASAPKAPEAKAPAAEVIDLPALRKFLEALQGKNLFERLGLPRARTADPKVKMTYFQLAKVYHPDTVPPEAPPEARALKEQILALINEGYATLSDNAARENYFDELEAQAQVGDLDVEAILAAEEDFQRATMLVRARKFAEAFALFDACVTRNPREAEFYAWRGYARFFGAQDKRAQKDASLEDMKTALELSPKCAVAWLFRGHIAKLLEDPALAKQAYARVLELEPNNIEAQRELRLFETRAKK